MNNFEPSVDLERFCQKSGANITHQIARDVEMLEALVAAQGVYHVVDFRSEFAVG